MSNSSQVSVSNIYLYRFNAPIVSKISNNWAFLIFIFSFLQFFHFRGRCILNLVCNSKISFLTIILLPTDTYGDLRMAHTGVSQVSYATNIYGNAQASNRIVSYQPTTTGLYYEMMSSQQQQQLLETHSPKIECPSSPCATRSPGIVSAGQSPDHHQLTSPHIVTLGSPSSSPAGPKIMLDNGHLERSTVVSISS